MVSATVPAHEDVPLPNDRFVSAARVHGTHPAPEDAEPSWYLHRPRLDALIDLDGLITWGRGAESRIVGLWDAAGSGKTSLMAAWARRLRAAGRQLAWYTGRDLLDAAGPADFAQRLLGPAEGSAPGADLVVFVDDLHILDPARLADLLTCLGQNAHSGRFVLSARWPPFTGTAALVAAGVLVECPDDTLAFTLAETHQLAAHRGIDLSAEDCAALWRHTGGWATGLALALTTGMPEGDVQGIRRFTGDTQAVADYLTAEVVNDLDEGDRDLLLRSAVAASVPLELGVLLTGRSDAGEVLVRIARRNTLVGRESDASGCDAFRYHPIFLAYLQAEARRRDALGARSRHLAACRWYSDRADGADALEQALLARAPELIGELLERFGLDLVLAGASDLVGRALRRIHGVAEHGELASTAALALRLLLEVPHFPAKRRAHQLLLAADAAVNGTTPARWTSVVDILHAFAATEHSEIQLRLDGLRTLDESQSGAMASAEGVDAAVDLLAATAEGRCLDELGQPAAAETTLRDAADSARAAGYDWLFLLANDLAATAAAHAGDWRHVTMLEDQMAEVAPHGYRPADAVGGRAMLYRLVRRYESCRDVDDDELEGLAASLGPWLDVGVSVPARALQLLVQLDTIAHPRHSLDRLILLMREVGAEHPRALSLCCVQLIALSGVLDGRAETQTVVRLVEKVLGEESLEALLLRFLLVPPTRAGHPAEERLRAAAMEERPCWRGTTIVSAWVALASVAEVSGRHVEADARLLRALRIAEQLGTERALLSVGVNAVGGNGVGLIRARLGRLGDLDEFARHVLQCADRLRPAERMAPPDGGQSNSVLTQRERELLRELPFHQSVADIARKRNVSPNTVKTHLRNIYQKLEASNRAEAVTIAQDRGLL